MSLFLMSCATTQSLREGTEIPPSEVFREVCRAGAGVKSVHGNLWLKVKSKEASGQFVGRAQADSQGNLDLEILNFLGGTEAIVKIQGSKYEVLDGNARKIRNGFEKYGMWAGLPMRWASELFLGKIPCPESDPSTEIRAEWDGPDQIRVAVSRRVPQTGASPELVPPQVYHYQVVRSEFGFRVQGLRWVGENVVEFRFSDLEPVTLSPKKWEVHSELGDLKVGWRDRDLHPSSSEELKP